METPLSPRDATESHRASVEYTRHEHTPSGVPSLIGRKAARHIACDFRCDIVLRQGDYRQIRISLRSRRGHADHVPHVVRTTPVSNPVLVVGTRKPPAHVARCAGGGRSRLLRLLPVEFSRLCGIALYQREFGAPHSLPQSYTGAGTGCFSIQAQSYAQPDYRAL